MSQPTYTFLEIIELAAEWLRSVKMQREHATANGQEPPGSVAFVERHAINLVKQALTLAPV